MVKPLVSTHDLCYTMSDYKITTAIMESLLKKIGTDWVNWNEEEWNAYWRTLTKRDAKKELSNSKQND